MAYTPHYQFTVSGGWTQSALQDETWDFGFKEALAVGGFTQADADAILAAMATLWHTGSPVGAQCTIKSLKIAPIGADGRYTDAPIVSDIAPQGGVSTSVCLPPRDACVITTHASTVFRGPGRYGRFYLPGLGQEQVLQGIITPARQATILSWAKSFLATVQTQVPGSRLVHAPSVGGLPLVDELWVGQLVDTQRRRSRQAVEAYVETTYP